MTTAAELIETITSLALQGRTLVGCVERLFPVGGSYDTVTMLFSPLGTSSAIAALSIRVATNVVLVEDQVSVRHALQRLEQPTYVQHDKRLLRRCLGENEP